VGTTASFYKAFPVPSRGCVSYFQGWRQPVSLGTRWQPCRDAPGSTNRFPHVPDPAQGVPSIYNLLLQCFASARRGDSGTGWEGTCLVFNNSISCNK